MLFKLIIASLTLLALLLPQVARASCALIPVALQELRSTQGTVDRALARPGDSVSVRIDLACNPTATGFDPSPLNNNLTLRFEAPGGPTTDVAVAVDSVENCGAAPGSRCDTLRFTVPDTDALVAPNLDGKGLTGPARILVDDQIEIAPLYLPTLSCDDQEPDGVFGQFTVLPVPTPFDPGTTEMLGTIDGQGNLLLPLDFSGILPADPGSPLFLLLEGSADLVAFTSSPGQFIRLPDKRYIRAFSNAGRPLPPFLETNSLGDDILGSVDAVASVIRIARVDPDNPMGPALFDLSDRLKAGTGPIEISLPTPLTALAVAPLESLTETPQIIAFAQDETVEGADRNSDGDLGDKLPYIVERGETTGTDTARTLVEVSTPLLGDVVIEAENDLLAFLESEAHGDVDRSDDDDLFDSILRVYSADGTLLAPTAHTTVDPSPLVGGRSLAVSDDFVFFRTREGDGIQRSTERVSVGPAGLEANGASTGPFVSAEGRYVGFTSLATNLIGAGNDTNAAADVFVHDRSSSTTLRVSVTTAGAQANGASTLLGMSPDARFLLFLSTATNLATPPFDANGELYVHDRDSDADGIFDEAGSISTVKLTSFNGDDLTYVAAAISDDGRHVTFQENIDSPVLACGTLVLDRDTDEDGIFDEVGATTTIGIATDAFNQCDQTDISGNGRFVAYKGPGQFFLYDRDTDEDGVLDEAGQISLDMILDDLNGFAPDFDPTGRFLAHWTDPTGTNAVRVRDRLAPTEVVSLTTNGAATLSPSIDPTISDDGRFVAFLSTDGGDPLVPEDNNTFQDVFVYDRTTNVIERVSVASVGTQANAASSAARISGDGRWVAFQSVASNLIASDGNLAADIFIRGHDGSGSSLNASDTDLEDTVLQVFARSTASLRSNARLVAREVDVAAGRAAVLGAESDDGNTNRNAAGGDTDTDDLFARLYDAHTDTITDLGGVAVSQIAISDTIVCLTVPEANENDSDRNGDGDTEDDVLAVWDIAGGTLTNVGVASGRIDAVGSKCVFVTPEAAQGPGGTDLNADADVLDDVLRIYDHADPAPTPQGRISETGFAAADFLVGGDLIAYRSCEADQGATVLNGDGDTADCVMQIFDHTSGINTNTQRAATPCTFSGCDPFFDPYRIEDAIVSFVTFEADQSGSQLAPGCFATGVVGQCDHTGDGDDFDTVMHVFHTPSGDVQVFEISDTDTDPVPPFPAHGMLAVQVREIAIGEDINGDGNIDAAVVTVVEGDTDGDGVYNNSLSNDDTCVEIVDDFQLDSDVDTLGDSCDPNDASTLPGDLLCDANLDSSITQTDIEIILGDQGMEARASDARDADTDGFITQADADLCAANCDVGQSCSSNLCGNGTIDSFAGEECDDANTASGDGCSGACQLETAYVIEGAANSGTITLTVDGITIVVSAPFGQDLQTVAQNVVDALNAQAGGAFASVANGNQIVTEGTVTAISTTDIGLSLPRAQCQDGLDNDSDTLTDANDPDCRYSTDHLELDVDRGDVLVAALGNQEITRLRPSTGATGPIADNSFSPWGVAATTNGLLYFTRGGSAPGLYRLDTQFGIVETIAVDAPFTPNPRGIAVDDRGRVVVVFANCLVERVDPATLVVETLTSLGGPSNCNGVAISDQGEIFVSGANTISRFSASGSFIQQYIRVGMTSPGQLSFESDGNLLIANVGFDSVLRLDPSSGVFSVLSLGIGTVYGVAVDPFQGILATDGNTADVATIHPTTGLPTYAGATPPIANPRHLTVMNTPHSVPALPTPLLPLLAVALAIAGQRRMARQGRPQVERALG